MYYYYPMNVRWAQDKAGSGSLSATSRCSHRTWSRWSTWSPWGESRWLSWRWCCTWTKHKLYTQILNCPEVCTFFIWPSLSLTLPSYLYWIFVYWWIAGSGVCSLYSAHHFINVLNSSHRFSIKHWFIRSPIRQYQSKEQGNEEYCSSLLRSPSLLISIWAN